MGIGKRGDEKYYIIISIILGLLVLGMAMYFIFNEYFTSEDIDRESCRQSVVLRDSLVEQNYAGFNIFSFKDKFPLKCKTSVITIDKKTKDATKVILDALANCWFTFGEGNYDIFPKKFFTESTCVPCARIHFDPSVVNDYTRDKKIDLTSALNSRKIDERQTYYDYLMDSGKKFPALSFAGGRHFNLESGIFQVGASTSIDGFLINRLTAQTEKKNLASIDLPKYIDAEKGDLFIFYGALNTASDPDKGIGNYLPYLFYFQGGQTGPNPFNEIRNSASSKLIRGYPLCSMYDGIPA
jgi:hypothetical protein